MSRALQAYTVAGLLFRPSAFRRGLLKTLFRCAWAFVFLVERIAQLCEVETLQSFELRANDAHPHNVLCLLESVWRGTIREAHVQCGSPSVGFRTW
jgi:hypothetical protein